MNRMTIAGLALAFLAGPLAAQTQIAPEADLDADGSYSFPELLELNPELTEQEFTALDLNGDGVIDASEVEAGINAGLIVPALPQE